MLVGPRLCELGTLGRDQPRWQSGQVDWGRVPENRHQLFLVTALPGIFKTTLGRLMHKRSLQN